jgi:hypothetical protein
MEGGEGTMQAPETDSAVIPFAASEEAAPASNGNYTAVRFNAIEGANINGGLR